MFELIDSFVETVKVWAVLFCLMIIVGVCVVVWFVEKLYK